MSFLKITDPAKRDFMFQEFQKNKESIKRDFLSERLGNQSQQLDFIKEYKPLLDAQTKISTELGSIKDCNTMTATALKALPAAISSLKAIQFPQYPSIEVYDDPVSDIKMLEIGSIAGKYLQQYASDKKATDTTFGIKSKDGKFYIGDSRVSVQGDDVTVQDKTYKGTPGLWELLTMLKPNNTIYDANDRENYAEILHSTNAMRQQNNPNKPKSSKSDKYRDIIKPIWSAKMGSSKMGQGVDVVILPQDPNELTEMLNVRMASFKAGNTGLRNEIVGICDELRRQKEIDSETYKKLMLRI